MFEEYYDMLNLFVPNQNTFIGCEGGNDINSFPMLGSFFKLSM